MATDYYIGLRFRSISDWCYRSQLYGAGWPNFHVATYDNPWRTVYGHYLLTDAVVDWRDVPASEYGATNMRTRFTGAHDYARRHGYEHGFPNFHQADYGAGTVYGTFLIVPGGCEWRDVRAWDLGLQYGDPGGYPMDRWFTGAANYAHRNGFVAGIPNGHYANYGQGYVCGVLLFRHGQAEWRDIRGHDLGLYEDPPPVSVPQTTVPRIEGLLDSQAWPMLEAARLRGGIVWNETGEYRSDRLRVVAQDPDPGTVVDEQSRVNYRVELSSQPQGVKSIIVTNRHVDESTVVIHVWDSGSQRWQSKGSLGISLSKTVTLSSGIFYAITAVDSQLINCTDGSPSNPSCQRLLWGARGDTSGIKVDLSVY